jgi:multisubunit Na+/H+ antiporter MnhB subunit
MKKIFTSVLMLLVSIICFAQEQVEMADELRSSGKIYVVVGVLVTILLGIIIYLIMIDRKLSDIEKRIDKK